MARRHGWFVLGISMLSGCHGAGGGDARGRDAAAAEDAARSTDAAPVDDGLAATPDAGRDGAPGATDGATDASSSGGAVRLLVFTKTEGFRHGSIEDGVDALMAIAEGRGWEVEHTEEAGRFSDEGLAGLDVVIWLNTTGDVLDEAQQAAFERWYRGGGGYVGVHSASDTEYDWAWYGELVGAWFESHPAIQAATLDVEDRSHPSTAHLGSTWMRTDEWYDFRRNPRDDVQVLMAVDETTYEGGSMGDDHPIAWHREHDGGRAFYTALGHTSESYTEPAFIMHLTGAIAWAAGAAE